MTLQKCMTFDLILFSKPWILIDIHRHMNEKLTRRHLNSYSKKEKTPKTSAKFIRWKKKNIFRNNKTPFLFSKHTKESSLKIESRNLLTVFMLTSLSRGLLCYCWGCNSKWGWGMEALHRNVTSLPCLMYHVKAGTQRELLFDSALWPFTWRLIGVFGNKPTNLFEILF